MTAPALSALRFLLALLSGGILGIVYGFLRPLRPRFTHFSDMLFTAAALYVWLFLHFRLCHGDLRVSYSIAMVLGGFLWELTAGRLLRPVFSVFWKGARKLWVFLWMPLKKICKKTKILFASGRKWVTIKWKNRRHYRRKRGGNHHGRTKKVFQQDSAGQAEGPEINGRDAGDCHRIVYGGPDRSAPFQSR